MQNNSIITNILLLGLSGSAYGVRIFLFIIFLVAYIISFSGNFFIIVLVSITAQLDIPMYNFLKNLSMCEIMLTSVLVPQILHVLLWDKGVLQISHCFFQFYVMSSSVATECFIFSVMSYDRYLAVCKPLHYFFTMKHNICQWLSIFCWLSGYILSAVIVIPICTLQFCGSGIMDHFFCDLSPILELACSDTSAVELEVLVFSLFVVPFPFTFIISMYFVIIVTILRLPHASRQREFSTCSSHLSVVSTYYGTLIIMYVVPFKCFSFNANKYWSLVYSIATPVLNPIIYSLRNKEIKVEMKKYVLEILKTAENLLQPLKMHLP